MFFTEHNAFAICILLLFVCISHGLLCTYNYKVFSAEILLVSLGMHSLYTVHEMNTYWAVKLQPMRPHSKQTEAVKCVTQHVTCELFSNSFSAGWCDTHNLWGSPKVRAGIYVQWKWQPGPLTPEENWKLINRTRPPNTPSRMSKRHSLYGCAPSCWKMLCPYALLSKWPEWPHFADASGTTGS